MANLIALYRLQQVDKQVEEIDKELQALADFDSGNSDYAKIEPTFEAAKAQRRDAERLLKDAELKLAALESEKTQSESKLFSGKITNSKELSQLERDLSQLGKQREKLDEQVLRAMDALEKANQDFFVKEKHLQESKIELEKEMNTRATRKENISRQLGGLKERRQSFSQALDESLLELYINLKERKGGLAIAKLQRNSCSACYMAAPQGTIQRVKALELEYCSSCGRILYLDKEM